MGYIILYIVASVLTFLVWQVTCPNAKISTFSDIFGTYIGNLGGILLSL